MSDKTYIWQSEKSTSSCEECKSLAGKVFANKDDAPSPPLHPNCKCKLVEVGEVTILEECKSKNRQEGKCREKTVKVDPKHHLEFDGKYLYWKEGEKIIKAWNAISGHSNYQSGRYQDLKGEGPLPEGQYVLQQSRHQEIGVKDSIIGIVGIGSWPKSIFGWGTNRIWLDEVKGNDMKDRDSFSVHGGISKGSNGCIDLTSEMGDFNKKFLDNGNNLLLEVKYPKGW